MSEQEPKSDKHKNDSLDPINEHVRINQSPPTGQGVLVKIDEIVHEYFFDERYERVDRFNRILRAEIGWIEKFVQHAPSVGSHYEFVLRDLLKEYLPSSIKVGTGFIYNSLHGTCSPQLDIIVYSDSIRSPIHRRGEFIIVDPDVVKGVCEVKKQLRTAELRSFINKTIGHYLGNCPSLPYGIQNIGIFAYECKTKISTLVQIIAEEIKEYISAFNAKTVDDELVNFGIFQLTLPSIYFYNQNEYISIRVRKDKENSITSSIYIEILKSPSGTGVSPFLVSMSQDLNHESPLFRDFISNYLIEVVSTTKLDIQSAFMRRIGNAELIQRFSDAKNILKQHSRNGEKYVGAIISSHEDIGSYSTLHSLSATKGFSWQVYTCKNTLVSRRETT